VALALRRRGFDVTTSAEARLLSATDSQQLAYCVRVQRVIITHDSDMIRLSSTGVEHFGIAYCHPTKYKIGGLLRKLLSLAQRIPQDQMRGRVDFL
jgi:predicted nuclease of predicted toxin-antitoxin system